LAENATGPSANHNALEDEDQRSAAGTIVGRSEAADQSACQSAVGGCDVKESCGQQ